MDNPEATVYLSTDVLYGQEFWYAINKWLRAHGTEKVDWTLRMSITDKHGLPAMSNYKGPTCTSAILEFKNKNLMLMFALTFPGCFSKEPIVETHEF